MSKNYCVFWYPTIFHQEKVHRDSNESTSFVEISDKDINKKFYLKVNEIPIKDHPDCYHLKFTLTDDNNEGNNHKTIDCTFSYSSHTRNGFVTYTYDRDKLKQDYWNTFLDSEEERRASIDNLKNRLRSRIIKKYWASTSPSKDVTPSDELVKDYVVDRILISFYHHAKGFYHEHEVQSQSDGKLVAYHYSKESNDGHRDYLTEPPTLSTKNNEVINWYLDQFEKQFVGYAEEISKQHREFTKRIDLRRRSRNAIKNQNRVEIKKCLIEYGCLQNVSIKWGENILPSISSLVKNAQQGISKMSPEEQNQELLKLTDSTSQSEIKELHAKLRVLSRLCGDALTEYTYCKALLGSKYNDDYKHDRYFNHRQVGVLSLYSNSLPKLSALDERRKKAFNIRNSIRYIEGVKQNCSRWENELTENLIENVHIISTNHQDTLRKVEELIEEVKDLSQNHDKTLSEIESLAQEAKRLSIENTKMLKASEISNLHSNLLGWLSVALAIIGIGFALMSIEEISNCAGYCVILAGIMIVIYMYGKYRVEKKKLVRK